MILAVLLLSCKDSGVSPPDGASGPVIFETEYINWAWGYAYEGTVVFQDGSLYAYNPGKDSVAVLHHSDGWYTETELSSKYAHRKLFVRTISPDTLRLMRQLALVVTGGTFSDTVNVGADMGAITYSVYQNLPESTRYHKSVLRVDGDWSFHNKSEAAIALADLIHRL